MNKQQVKEALMTTLEVMVDELFNGYEDLTYTDLILEGVTESGDDEHTIRISLGIEDLHDQPSVYAFNKKITSVDLHTPLEEDLEVTIVEERSLK